MIEDIVTIGESFVAGIVIAGFGVYRLVNSRITPEKAQRIRQDVEKAIADYNAAKEKGPLTADDKLKLAEDALDTLQEIVKDLEQ